MEEGTTCEKCHVSFASANTLSRHKKRCIEGRVFTCECSKTFTRKPAQDNHMKMCSYVLLRKEIEDLKKEIEGLKKRPSVINIENNYNNYNFIKQVVGQGLICHVDEDVIYDSVMRELSQPNSSIKTKKEVQDIVYNALIGITTSSNKRDNNMLYNIVQKLVERDITAGNEIIMGIRKALTPVYKERWERLQRHYKRKENRDEQSSMDEWYWLLRDYPSVFMNCILKKLHIKNYLTEDITYNNPMRIGYDDNILAV